MFLSSSSMTGSASMGAFSTTGTASTPSVCAGWNIFLGGAGMMGGLTGSSLLFSSTRKVISAEPLACTVVRVRRVLPLRVEAFEEGAISV
jgi:hypothetical protein